MKQEEKNIFLDVDEIHHQKVDKITSIIVFDLNKTLFIKSKQRTLELQSHGKVQGEFIHLRPYVRLIGSFIEEHKNIKVLGWTTMQGSKRASQFLKLFQLYGVKFDRILYQQHCIDSQIKDLKIVHELYGVAIDNCILIDDSAYKRNKDQNFINIQRYEGNEKDEQLLDALLNLDKFIKCQEECSLKKIINKSINLQKFKQNHQRKQYKLQSSIKEGSTIKNILFDINQSLLLRVEQPLKEMKPLSKFKKSYLYFRPHITRLIQFISDHKIDVFLLVDEKSLKRVKNLNCIQMNPCKKYDMENEDIVSLMMQLERGMGCRQDCVMKKI